ncbi:MAG: hypothetical protein R2747_17285 [Pyrinomonadaceae bacterium]
MLSSLLFLTGCGNGGEANGNDSAGPTPSNENANVVGDNVLELGKIINLPFEPDESTVWREINLNTQNSEKRVPGPNEKKLIAVMKFTPEQTAEIIKSAEKHGVSAPAQLDAENWFPAELVAQSQEAGDATLKGNSYAADDFIKHPYTGGKLTRIVNTDYFVLEITSF